MRFVLVFHSCIDNQLHSCSTLLAPGTFPLCHRRRIRGCRTGAAVTRTEDHGAQKIMEHLIQPIPGPQCFHMLMTLQRWRKKWSALSRTHIIFHTQHLSHATLSHTYDYIHTNIRTYIHTHTYILTYIHTYIPTVLPSRSFTTSFVFPSFPVPAKTIEAHYWKKLTCGVIRSLIFFLPWFAAMIGKQARVET